MANVKTRIDPDWVCSPELASTILGYYPQLNLQAERDKFVGYYQEKNKPRANWNLSFVNWCHQSIKFDKRDTLRSPAGTGRKNSNSETVDERRSKIMGAVVPGPIDDTDEPF